MSRQANKAKAQSISSLPPSLEEERQSMHRLPETGFLRLAQIIGDTKSVPPVQAIIPVSKSTWWVGVKSGRYPQPVRTLGENHGLESRGYSGTDRAIFELIKTGGLHSNRLSDSTWYASW
jgi:hypothetical protein